MSKDLTPPSLPAHLREGRQEWLGRFVNPAPGTAQRAQRDARSRALLRDPELGPRVKEQFRRYTAIVSAQQQSGAGLLADEELRYLQRDYHNRFINHGAAYLPTHYRIGEAFFESRTDAPGFYLLPEKDYKASVQDFLDYITGPDGPEARLELGYGFIDGHIYNLTSTDLPDALLLETRGDSSYSVRAANLVRRGDELVVMLSLGEQLSSERLQEMAANMVATNPVAWKPEIASTLAGAQVIPELVPGTSLLACKALARFNLAERRMEARCLLRDMGSVFSTLTDEPEALGGGVIADSEAFQKMVRELDDCDAVWEIAKTLTLLPAYLAARLPWSHETRAATALGEVLPKSLKARRQLEPVSSKDKVLFKLIRAIEPAPRDAHRPCAHQYVAPAFQVAVDGYWRKLPSPQQHGHGPDGKPELGRTWVRSHIRHKDKAPPAGPKIVFIKESLSEARRRLERFRGEVADVHASALDLELPSRSGAPTAREPGQTGAFVYVMRCHAHAENLFKVGFTDRDPEVRARELSSATASPSPFQVLRAWVVSDGFRAEQSAHELLKDVRLSENREFFHLAYEELCAKVGEAVSAWLL